MDSRGEPELQQYLARYAGVFNEFLSRRIVPDIRRRTVPPLAEPMIYSLEAPGKRLRPVLCLWAAGVVPDEAIGGAQELSETRPAFAAPTISPEPSLASSPATSFDDRRLVAACYAAAAVEAIHTYSLIHDDLPAMDDDDLRRGRPSCHRQFSEWAAILAGDALNTYAFELLGEAVRAAERPELLPDLLSALADGAGRMVCGQALDLETEAFAAAKREIPAARERLDEIHRKKTAALIRASLELGAILGGDRSPASRSQFREFGEGLGLLFQITDDLLDVQGDSAALGKTAGKDAASGKLTYPALYGTAGSEERAAEIRARLEKLSADFTGGPSELRGILRNLPAFVAARKR